MTTFEEETFLSYAVVDEDGTVKRCFPYAINSLNLPGGRRATCAQDQADDIASWPAPDPGYAVHVWIGGGVDVPDGDPVSAVRAADAVALVGAVVR